MILGTHLTKKCVAKSPEEGEELLLSLEHYISERDWTGACTLLACRHGDDLVKEPNSNAFGWNTYCLMHKGEFEKVCTEAVTLKSSSSLMSQALTLSEKRAQLDTSEESLLQLALCYYYLGQYEEALDTARKVADGTLKTCLVMHCEDRMGRDAVLEDYKDFLDDMVPQIQLSMAAVQFRRECYEEAIALYQHIREKHEQYIALDFYIAQCYAKLEDYDLSLQHADAYLDHHPDSVCALNLKAVNTYKTRGADSACEVLGQIHNQHATTNESTHLLTQHNMAVFQPSDNNPKLWETMKRVIPEATLNLMIWHLRQETYTEAEKLATTLEAANTPTGLAHMCYGQQHEKTESLQLAQEYLQAVGSNALHCDTVLGRQCMALCFMLSHQYEDALVFLESIRDYSQKDDAFKWNYGFCLAKTRDFVAAQKQLETILTEEYRSDDCFLCWLARCYIANGQAELAWNLYLEKEDTLQTTTLLEVIANDCYVTGAFLVSAQAFDVLCRVEPESEHQEGKYGAIVGAFRAIVTQQAPTEHVDELLQLSHQDDHPHAEQINRVIWQWTSSL